MKILRIAILPLLFAISATAAQNSSQQPPAAKTGDQQQTATPGPNISSAGDGQVDPAKQADILRLLEVSGAKANMLQVVDSMGNTMRPIMTNSLPPGDYRETLINLFVDKFQIHMKYELQGLLNKMIPIYDEHFSDDDIKGLILFYETPLGQKATTELPKLMIEMQGQGMQLGEKIGRQSMLEVLTENPELAKALQEASKTARLQSPGPQ